MVQIIDTILNQDNTESEVLSLQGGSLNLIITSDSVFEGPEQVQIHQSYRSCAFTPIVQPGTQDSMDFIQPAAGYALAFAKIGDQFKIVLLNAQPSTSIRVLLY